MTRQDGYRHLENWAYLNTVHFAKSHEESKDCKSDFGNCILESVALKGNPGTTH